MNTIRLISYLTVMALATAGTATTARAQQRTVGFGISGGLGLPTGDMADAQSTGYHVAGHLNFAPASLPVEILVDGTYHNFGRNTDLPGTAKFSYFNVGASAAYVFPGVAMRPYLMGGVGMYFGKADAPGADNESEFGFNAGVGLRFILSGFNSFLQARVNVVDDNTFVPISFGIVF